MVNRKMTFVLTAVPDALNGHVWFLETTNIAVNLATSFEDQRALLECVSSLEIP